MRRVLLGLAVWMAVQGIVSCGGGSGTTAITITPTSATVGVSQTFQFSATVTDNSNTTVTWEVNGVAGGNTTTGTVSTAGLYTAPATLSSTTTSVTVTAVSAGDTSKTASATVTLTSSSSSTATTPPFISITPTFVTLNSGAQQTFVATLNTQGQAPTAANVTWSLTCQSQTAGACGTISSTGVFTAPASPPPGGQVSITATSTDNTASPANAGAAIVFSPNTLSGQYAFLLRGTNAGAEYAAAGSITFSSATITGGTMDVNSGGTVSSVTITGGTYHVGSDGRINATINTTSGSQTWQMVLLSNSEIFVERFDTSTVRASGTMSLQNSAQFTQGAITGKYTLRVGGVNIPASSAKLKISGAVVSDGVGNLTAGFADVNSGGTTTLGQPLAGTYTASSGPGRGTLTITSGFATQHFVYYIIDSQRAKLVETDTTLVTGGDLVQESSGPFTNASFTGNYAFTLEGSSSLGPLGEGGTFTLDGAGHVSAGSFDTNNDGTFTPTTASVGTYSVADATTGRTTMTLTVNGSSLNFVFYPQTGGSLNLVQVDSLRIANGVAFPQTTAALNNASFGANFGVRLSGFDFSSSPGQEDVVGQIIPNGGSALSGTLDINDNGTLSSATAGGSYSINSTTLRGTLTLTTSFSGLSSAAFNIYVVDSTRILLLGTDSNRVLVGSTVKQF